LTIERTFYKMLSMEKRTIRSVERSLASFFRENRRMPTYSEMIDILMVRSKSVVYFWVQKLIAQGLLERDRKGFLRPVKSSFGLPLVGDVQAGFPSPAEEELQDVISFDEYLITRPENSFIIKVRGDSMIGEGIMAGDLAILDKGKEPKNGDIVLAEVDGEWTLKYFKRQGKKVVLEAANPNYPTIRAKLELRIGGVVTAVIRKYRV
jgi:SOS regulatory protein LexA